MAKGILCLVPGCVRYCLLRSGQASKKQKGWRDLGKDGTERVHKLSQEVAKWDCKRI